MSSARNGIATIENKGRIRKKKLLKMSITEISQKKTMSIAGIRLYNDLLNALVDHCKIYGLNLEHRNARQIRKKNNSLRKKMY